MAGIRTGPAAVALLALCALAGVATATDKLAITFGPGAGRLFLATMGPNLGEGKLGSSVQLPSSIGRVLYTATAGSYAFTAGAVYKPTSRSQGDSYITVTNVKGATPKIVTTQKLSSLGGPGAYYGCPFAEQGNIAAQDLGGGNYRIYVTVGCTFKCVKQVRGGARADNSYVIALNYKAQTGKFSGPLSTRYIINDGIGCVDVFNAPVNSRHVSALRVTGGSLYAVISYDTASKSAQLYKLSGGKKTTVGVSSGIGCGSSVGNATSTVRSSTAFYSSCFDTRLTNRVEYNAKGGSRVTVGGTSSTVGNTHYYGMVTSASRFYLVRQIQFPQAGSLYQQQIVAQSKSLGPSSKPVVALALPRNSDYDFKSNFFDLDVIV